MNKIYLKNVLYMFSSFFYHFIRIKRSLEKVNPVGDAK